jgi:5-methylcytosine-specific restriction endonuclease McrA
VLAIVVESLLRYDPSARTFAGYHGFGAGLGVSTYDELVGTVRELTRALIRSDEIALCTEFGEWLRYRAIFALIPESCLFDRPREEKPIIRQHLQALGLEPTDKLVSAVKLLCTNFRAKREGGSRKPGISDVRVKFPHLFQKIMAEQGERCWYCGERLTYGENAQLDHVIPFFLGDDPPDGSNWRFACETCNRGKGRFPYYSLIAVGANWIDTDVSKELSQAVRFAALARDRRCTQCGVAPREERLHVEKVIASGCWILDNVRTLCERHRP